MSRPKNTRTPGGHPLFERVYDEYYAPLVKLAGRLLRPRLRRRVDADDIVQSAFRSVFGRIAEGDCRFDHSRALRGYLLKVTLNKARSRANSHLAQKRDVTNEIDWSDGMPVASANSSPDTTAAFADELRFLTSGFTQRDLQVLGLCLEGHTTAEIARAVGCSRWTVRRVLDCFGHRWQRRAESVDGG